MDKKGEQKEVPSKIFSPLSGQVFTKGKFLGKGGFARCYELLDEKSGIVYAGKIVSKTLLIKKHQRDKMAQEIEIHRSLNHPNIVKFYGNFEDSDHVFILLELCPKRSLMELHKRRKYVTEPEAKYFGKQIIEACIYLHDSRIIHRDLKLGNLFLNEDMAVKIGDFGLATRVDFNGEKKKTLCGTPNYIAPEMLDKKGHSYEVDVWAIGCIMFTLLVGKPPFETTTLKETYSKIKHNDYVVPNRVSFLASSFIRRLLAPDPSSRPTVKQLLDDEFFTGFTPNRLPATCLTMAPKYLLSNQQEGDNRKSTGLPEYRSVLSPRQSLLPSGRPLTTIPESRTANLRANAGEMNAMEMPPDCFLADLFGQLNDLLIQKPIETKYITEEACDPAASPVFWISRWVDYSDKYGLGYQLSDNSVGVMFNDNTILVLSAIGGQVQYIERNCPETYFMLHDYPEELKKKMVLLNYFRDFMNNHLQKACDTTYDLRDGDELARLPYLRTWFRTDSAIILHLNNGILQINFFVDHIKIILCPLMGCLTLIDSRRQFRVLKFESIRKMGCTPDIYSRLKYARTIVERLLSSSSSRPGSLSTAHYGKN